MLMEEISINFSTETVHSSPQFNPLNSLPRLSHTVWILWRKFPDLRESIQKSGPADLAQEIDFAYFLYTERLSCPNTKTTIRLIRSFKFIELWEIFWSPQWTLVATQIQI